jgi:hypothetical protein
MANQIEVAQVVAMIGSAYPNFSPTKETVGVYYELLKDLPLDLLRASALQCCAEAGRKFAPSVGELRGAASEIERRAQGIPSALEAWNETCNAPYRDYGKYPLFTGGKVYDEAPNPHQWSHPLVERVAKLLGWPNFPNPENESVDRAHFLKQYEIEVTNQKANAIELPAVTQYIESRQKALPVGEKIKQLTEGLRR